MIIKEKIIILGAKGMLGHMLYDNLKTHEDIIVYPLTRDEIDFNEHKKLLSLIGGLKPTCVINCAGILVRPSENDPQMAAAINTQLPTIVNDYCKKHSIQFIHISTDCVFKGNKFSYYTLYDTPNAETVYGQTKAQAEKNVLEQQHGIVLRTSIIGPEIKLNGTGLLHWVLMNSDPVVQGYVQNYWNGVTTLYLTKIITSLFVHKQMHGLYHVVGEDTTKYTLIKIIKGMWNKKFILQTNNTNKKDMRLMPDCFPIKSQFEMLSELFYYMKKNKQRYPYYGECV